MDKEQALHEFWSSFGIEAYDENTVPDSALYPRLTYDVSTAGFGSSVGLRASLWYHSLSWRDITAKAKEICTAIGLGGLLVPYDGGAIWIKRGVPFAQRMNDPDTSLRRIVIMIDAEFLEA